MQVVDDLITRSLADFNRVRLDPGYSGPEHHPDEIPFVEAVLGIIRPEIPLDADLVWYEGLLSSGPGQGDPLFPWLAQQASYVAMQWFLIQEAAGEAGFDDLVALTQVKMLPRAKMEMARNYWDEMGQGDPKTVHGKLLADSLAYFKVDEGSGEVLSEPLVLSNFMTALACHRRYAFHSVGALGVIEMTAPGRVGAVADGMRRLGVPADARRYFALHATLDVKHSREWNREVVGSLPMTALRPMLEGAYARLWLGARCFEAYRSHLWSGADWTI
jgi:hypothetical protein